MWTRTANGANKKLVLNVQLRCGLLSITTPVSHLANDFDAWSELHGQVSLAAVSQILCRSWGYERLQKSKDSLKACFENVNIVRWLFCIKDSLKACFENVNIVRWLFCILFWYFSHRPAEKTQVSLCRTVSTEHSMLIAVESLVRTPIFLPHWIALYTHL